MQRRESMSRHVAARVPGWISSICRFSFSASAAIYTCVPFSAHKTNKSLVMTDTKAKKKHERDADEDEEDAAAENDEGKRSAKKRILNDILCFLESEDVEDSDSAPPDALVRRLEEEMMSNCCASFSSSSSPKLSDSSSVFCDVKESVCDEKRSNRCASFSSSSFVKHPESPAFCGEKRSDCDDKRTHSCFSFSSSSSLNHSESSVICSEKRSSFDEKRNCSELSSSLEAANGLNCGVVCGEGRSSGSMGELTEQMRYLLRASDDELGIPPSPSVPDDSASSSSASLEDVSVNSFDAPAAEGFWRLEDELNVLPYSPFSFPEYSLVYGEYPEERDEVLGLFDSVEACKDG